MNPKPDGRPAAIIGSEWGAIAGRYELLEQIGIDTSVHAAYWRARDTVLQRDVGLTMLLRAGEPGENERADEMADRALRWGRFTEPGCARLLDVMRRDNGTLPEDVLGLAVTEWVSGQSLAEAVSDGPLRTTAVLGMLDPLARAAEAAHRQGLVLGCVHPQRIRFAPEGGARLAFAMPPPAATPADDVRGLGATLYTLLTGHWPLSGTDAELAGLAAAPRDVQDVVVPPGILRPGLSLEVSALTLGALGAGAPHGRVHTAAAVHKVVTELLATEQEAALLPPADDGAPLGTDEVWHDDGAPGPQLDPDRRRKLRIGMGGLGVAAAVVIVYVLVQLGSMFGVTPSSSPRIVVANPQTPGAPAEVAPDQALSGLVLPASTTVFAPSGDPDNTGRAARAVDGDPTSSWSTYTYRQPFPALKPGVGLMVSFASPVQLSQLTISSPSRGSRIEIRSAPTTDVPLAQTVLIGTTNLEGPKTTVPMAGSQPVQHLLLWITKLGGGDEENVTEIFDVRFERALG
ncbi:MAG: protein kinase family protein [Pseudonocardia sp.]